MDIFRHFRGYAVAHLGKDDPYFDGGVYEFAAADNDQKLVAFCEKFGPVCGDLLSLEYQGRGAFKLVVDQSLVQLRRERDRFFAAVRLLNQIRKGADADLNLTKEAIGNIRIDDDGTFGMVRFWDKLSAQVRPENDKFASLMLLAEHALCDLLNECPLKSVPLGGRLFDLPYTEDSGIRSALYHTLRCDYYARRQIGTCLNCGTHFAVTRRGTRGCSQGCRTAIRNREYWERHKAEINAGRSRQTRERK
ncbi:hypothetical protein [Granulicella aggregans]|uniref:hypothetical protein n=1 Tax=Granulicella aggregans TaxID=474949 RepID=UPI0021DFDD74|nr:hypothetical protein [Granulicella aggregans]